MSIRDKFVYVDYERTRPDLQDRYLNLGGKFEEGSKMVWYTNMVKFLLEKKIQMEQNLCSFNMI